MLPGNMRVERPDDLLWAVERDSDTAKAVQRFKEGEQTLFAVKAGAATAIGVSGALVAGSALLTSLAVRASVAPGSKGIDAGVGIGIAGGVLGAGLFGTACMAYVVAGDILEPEVDAARSDAFRSYDASLRERLGLPGDKSLEQLRADAPRPESHALSSHDADDDVGPNEELQGFILQQ
jgi:hypothetical protein